MKKCYRGWAEDAGNTQGKCCCNCKWQRPISGHPWNKNIPQLSGSVTDVAGWGCTAGDMPTIVFFETNHGMCEMHTTARFFNGTN